MWFVVVSVLVFLLVKKYMTDRSRGSGRQQKENKGETPVVPSNEATNVEPDYDKAYQRKYLFTRNEKSELRKLIAWASTHNYHVFPKVRLLDIIEPRSGCDNYKSLFWKIQARGKKESTLSPSGGRY